MPKKILTVGMGGTISAKNPENTWESGEINQETLLKFLPFKRIKANARSATLFRIDSSDVHPYHWMTLVKYISYNIDSVDAIIVTHGTNSLAYTAAALSFMIQNPQIPIVITGGMTPLNQPGSDSPINLEDSFRVAIEGTPREVCVVFNHRIFRGSMVKKQKAAEFDAFGSPDGPLGMVDQAVGVFSKPRFKFRRRTIFPELDPLVQFFKVTPAFDPDQIRWAIDRGYHGIVLDGYGIGKVPVNNEELMEILEQARDRHYPICLTTSCTLSPEWKPLYEKETPRRLKELELIPCMDMTPEATLVKMMWVLAQTRDYKKIRTMMTANYVGEKKGEFVK